LVYKGWTYRRFTGACVIQANRRLIGIGLIKRLLPASRYETETRYHRTPPTPDPLLEKSLPVAEYPQANTF